MLYQEDCGRHMSRVRLTLQMFSVKLTDTENSLRIFSSLRVFEEPPQKQSNWVKLTNCTPLDKWARVSISFSQNIDKDLHLGASEPTTTWTWGSIAWWVVVFGQVHWNERAINWPDALKWNFLARWSEMKELWPGGLKWNSYQLARFTEMKELWPDTLKWKMLIWCTEMKDFGQVHWIKRFWSWSCGCIFWPGGLRWKNLLAFLRVG